MREEAEVMGRGQVREGLEGHGNECGLYSGSLQSLSNGE